MNILHKSVLAGVFSLLTSTWHFAFPQCPNFFNDDMITQNPLACEGDSIIFTIDGTYFSDGTSVEFYLTHGTHNPYQGGGILQGSVPVSVDNCSNVPEILYIMVNPHNMQVGNGNDKSDEFLILWTGSGGYSTSDILVTNLSDGTFAWTEFVAGNTSVLSCGAEKKFRQVCMF